MDCHVDGEPAPELVEPVVQFAKADLVRELDAYTGYTSRTVETRLADDERRHDDGFFTELVVRSRSNVGQVRVRQREVLDGHTSWGGEIVYCAHVSNDRGTREVVLEEIGRAMK